MVKDFSRSFIPGAGDVVWIDFDPVRGHEQGGYRLALVISPKYYSKRSKIVLVCPITSKEKGYPYEVVFSGKKAEGVILVDQLKSFDFSVRQMKFIEKIDGNILCEIKDKIHALID